MRQWGSSSLIPCVLCWLVGAAWLWRVALRVSGPEVQPSGVFPASGETLLPARHPSCQGTAFPAAAGAVQGSSVPGSLHLLSSAWMEIFPPALPQPSAGRRSWRAMALLGESVLGDAVCAADLQWLEALPRLAPSLLCCSQTWLESGWAQLRDKSWFSCSAVTQSLSAWLGSLVVSCGTVRKGTHALVL